MQHGGLIVPFKCNTDYNTVGMCISVTEVNTIHISMHCEQSDTLKIHMKQLLMKNNIIHPLM